MNQQLRSYHNEIETRNREQILCSSSIVPGGLFVAEPLMALRNTAHLYSNQADMLMGIKQRFELAISRLGAR